MILGRVLDFLSGQRTASVTEIALAVDSPPDVVRSMLETLQRKGRVHRLEVQDGCGSSCRQCAQGSIEVYVYGARPQTGVPLSPCERRPLQR